MTPSLSTLYFNGGIIMVMENNVDVFKESDPELYSLLDQYLELSVDDGKPKGEEKWRIESWDDEDVMDSGAGNFVNAQREMIHSLKVGCAPADDGYMVGEMKVGHKTDMAYGYRKFVVDSDRKWCFFIGIDEGGPAWYTQITRRF